MPLRVAVGVEHARRALRAQPGNVNPGWRYTGADELVAIGQREIEIGTSGLAGLEPSAEGVFTMPVRAERVHHFQPHFSATTTQARTERGHQIGRRGPERVGHRADRNCRRTVHRASPPRVRGTDHTQPGVGKQDWSAVCYPHPDRTRPIVTDDHVSLGTLPLGRSRSSRNRNRGAVHLPYQ